LPSDLVAASTDAARVTAVLTLAFASDPMTRWSFPDPAVYLARWPQMIRAFGGNAFELGTAHQAGDFSGAALWLPPGAEPDVEQLAAIFEDAAPPERQADGFAVFEQMGGYHPHEPHWYLPLIGVDPACQGKGIGSRLLEHALQQVDRDHLPAYLESSNPANISLYQRHGFEVLGQIQAGSSPTVTPMLRKARPCYPIFR
jgi:ribosomal protein S18 acetylase RimI-like enzyme